jgi:Sec-independent protein translocase protein TatA
MFEIILVLVVAIVVVGPDRLPQVVRWLGRQYGKLMRASDELRRAFTMEAERVEAEERGKILRKRRDEARERIETARAQSASGASVPRPLIEPVATEASTELGDSDAFAEPTEDA